MGNIHLLSKKCQIWFNKWFKVRQICTISANISKIVPTSLKTVTWGVNTMLAIATLDNN